MWKIICENYWRHFQMLKNNWSEIAVMNWTNLQIEISINVNNIAWHSITSSTGGHKCIRSIFLWKYYMYRPIHTCTKNMHKNCIWSQIYVTTSAFIINVNGTMDSKIYLLYAEIHSPRWKIPILRAHLLCLPPPLGLGTLCCSGQYEAERKKW